MRIGENNYIHELQLHNEEALLYVIDEYGGLIMSVIRKHLFRMQERQEECFDDVLLNIWQNISRYDEKKNSFKNWVAAIARYRCIDYLRQYRHELEMLNIEDVMIAEEDMMLKEMVEREISEEVEKMLALLKPLDRELFMKLYVEEKSVGQVSDETGLKKDVIYNRVSRGKRKIGKRFLRN